MITFLVLLSSQVSVLHATEYSYQPGSFTWEEARDHCAFLGMKIAFIKDARQNAEIGRHMPQEQNSWAWIGNPGNTGQNVYSNFLPNRGVPGNAHPCARIFSKVWNSYDDKWDDQDFCDTTGPVVCEHTATGTCPSLKKISGSHDWWACYWHVHMTNCGDGCCCEDGYQYKDKYCQGMAGPIENNSGFNGIPGFLEVDYDGVAEKCCWNENSAVFIGDMRPGHVVQSIDGCTSWTCVNGVMQKTHNFIPIIVGKFMDNLCEAPDRERDCEEGYTKRSGHPCAKEEHERSPVHNDMQTREKCADLCTSDSDCIAYTANGVCMLMHYGQVSASLGPEEDLGINYCVKDTERRKL